MHIPTQNTRRKALRAALTSCLFAVLSTMRCMGLFLSGIPRTPLRVLCLVAFDTRHWLRKGKRLSLDQLKRLATLLDFGACINAIFDHKKGCRNGHRLAQPLMGDSEIGLSVLEYLQRLSHLEGNRPIPGGDQGQFQKVSGYREAVVRLSLGMVAIAGCSNQHLDEAIEDTYGESDLNLLFRIVMQCQILDDVLDYSEDRSARLPSFLTACHSLPQALELTQRAVHGYAEGHPMSEVAEVFPLRLALFHVSRLTHWVVTLRRWSVAPLGMPPPTKPIYF